MNGNNDSLYGSLIIETIKNKISLYKYDLAKRNSEEKLNSNIHLLKKSISFIKDLAH